MKVISGGQTGVDRAALDEALAQGLEIGGYCPRGRRADDGPLDARYPLREMNSSAYPPRTRMNIVRSDVTLILRGHVNDSPGTRLTAYMCLSLDVDFVEVDLDNVTELTYEWVLKKLVGKNVINVAGPREASKPGIYEQARTFLKPLFQELSK